MRALHLPERFGGQHLPAIEAIDLRARRPAARALHRAAARGGGEDRARARRAGAAVSQPPRLCAAHAVPRLRLSPRVPELRCLAGRSPLQAAAGLPSLRLLDAAAGAMSAMPGGRIRSSPVGPGVERLRGGGGGAVSRQRASSCSPATWSNRSSGCARNSTTSPKGGSTSSSARSSSPRAITFPKLNLVGVVDADLGLGNGDPRAAERTFQLLHQVVGRAGREAGQGIGFLQTHQPEHPVMRALIAGDREAFYASEIEVREKTQLSAVRAAGEPDRVRRRRARGRRLMRARLAALAPRDDEVRVLGPAEAPLAVVRGRYRFRLLVKSPRSLRSVGLYARVAGRVRRSTRATSSSKWTSIRRASFSFLSRQARSELQPSRKVVAVRKGRAALRSSMSRLTASCRCRRRRSALSTLRCASG